MIIELIRKIHHKLLLKQAISLNKQLYQDVQSIPQDEMGRFESEFRQYAQERNYEAEYEQEFFKHRYRIYLSLKWLEQAITGLGSSQQTDSFQGLEVGEATIITDMLNKSFPQISWQNSTGDIRYPWEIPDASIDVIVNMEVAEHVSDLPDGINHGFFFTGLEASLREAYRVLKPGGIMFMTTPNAGSIYTLHCALAGEPPWIYPYHVREYTMRQIRTFLEEAGFTIQRSQAIHCLSIDKNIDYTVLFLALLGSAVFQNFRDRGDDLFIVTRK